MKRWRVGLTVMYVSHLVTSS